MKFMHKINIEAKDEPNVIIINKAKSKAFDIMGIVFGIVIFIYAFMKADFLMILLLAGTYLLVHIIYIVYLDKYSKEI